MNYTLGSAVTLATSVKVGTVLTDDPGLTLTILKPDGDIETFTGVELVHDATGEYHVDYLGDLVGIYTWGWQGDALAQGASEGTFEIESILASGVTDLRDLRVLIPACRRAIDGPMATAPDAPSTTLDDRAVLALIADSTAELILFTQGESSFGYQLVPTARDPFYLAPVAWATDLVRDPAADAAILSQAALDHYFWLIKLMKVSETMKNEAVDWEYSLSANVIAAWIAYLIANRDKAIAALQVINAPMDAYISLVAERDRLAAAWLEPWVAEIGAPVPYVGGGGSGPLEYDYRFSTWGVSGMTDVAAEVETLRQERAQLLAERADAEKARADAQAKVLKDAADRVAEEKAAALLAERIQLASEVERLRQERAEVLATAVVVDATEVERLRQRRETDVSTTVTSVAAIQSEQSKIDELHTAEQDRRLQEINGSQERQANLMAVVQAQLLAIQKGIDETAAVAKALAEKGVSAKLMVGLATGIIIPLLALIIAVAQGH